MQITRAGFGAWAIGGADWANGWSTQDDGDSVAAIRRAVESGVNWIDTAAVYGLGHSERIVARAVAGFSSADRPYVFTKGGLIWDEGNRTAPPRRIAASASLRRELEDSLRRLDVEQIDLYQLHQPPNDGTPIEEYWTTLLEMKREGKIRAAGLSNHTAAQLEVAERIGHVDSLQPPFSAIRRDAAAAELPWCASHGTSVIVYSPMQAGLLTGTFSVARVAGLPADDWRSRSNWFRGDALERNLRLADALRPIATRHGTSPASVAVAWTLAWPGVTGAIVGARRPQQVEGWLDALRLELPPDDVEEIARAIEHTGAGTGPARPDGAA
jgi:aryl-alcohol dehydrogenase-like predicted oxidoreductase